MDEILEQVDFFVYLGTVIPAYGDCREDVKFWLGKTRNVMYQLDKL